MGGVGCALRTEFEMFPPGAYRRCARRTLPCDLACVARIKSGYGLAPCLWLACLPLPRQTKTPAPRPGFRSAPGV